MAASADPPSSHHFPRGSDPAAGSPRSRRKNLPPSPRSQAVRLEPEAPSPSPSPPPSRSSSSTAAEQAPCSPRKSALQPESGSEESPDGSRGNVVSVQPKKPAWNKPSSEAVDVGPVMGDPVSWPALSESARASPKSLLSVDSSSSKAASVESVSNSQVLLEISSRPPVLHSPQKQAASNSSNGNSQSNNSPTARQKLNRRSGGANSNFPNAYGPGGFAHRPIPPPPPLPPFPVFHPNPYGAFIPPIANTTVRDPTYKGNNWDRRPVRGFVSPPHVMTDHRNSSRRGNSGPHHRGDSSTRNSNNNGTRRDKDRGNFSGARDVNVQPHRANPRGFVRSSPPPPTSPPFVGPPPVRPFVPMNFADITPQFYIPALPMEPYSGGPFFPPPPSTPMFVPVSDPSLASHIVHQIEYYFSDDNLVKDEFLKAKMDTEGWVPISLIASFPRVMSLTTNIQFILESLRDSMVVEVQNDKVRRRSEWAKWIYRGLRASRSSYDELATSFEKMTADEVPANQNDITGEADVHRDAVPTYSPKSTDQVQHPDTVGIDY